MRLLLILLFFSFFGNSQPAYLDWVKAYDGTSTTKINDAVIDDFGNHYVVGNLIGSGDFDPGPKLVNLTSSSHHGDILISKIDKQGDVIWAYTLGASVWIDEAHAVTVDSSGCVYITGRYKGTVDFDAGPGVNNLVCTKLSNCFILKINQNGSFVWVKNIGSYLDIEYGTDIEYDHSTESIVVVGCFRGGIDFDPGPGTYHVIGQAGGTDNIFMLKLKTNGDFSWVKAFAPNISPLWAEEYKPNLLSDTLGNLILTGTFEGQMDIDPDTTVKILYSKGMKDVFVSKFDSLGNLIWGRSFGGVFSEANSRITINNNRDVLLAGTFSSPVVDFNPSSSSGLISLVGWYDIFLLKLDENGTFKWVKSTGGKGKEYVNDIITDEKGDILLTGTFEDSTDLNFSAIIDMKIPVGRSDFFIIKFDHQEEFEWVNTFGGVNSYSNAKKINYFDALYTYGHFDNMIDFKPGTLKYNVTPLSGLDFFIQKLKYCYDDTVKLSQVACDSLTWIDGNTYYSDTNSIQFLKTNSVGCKTVYLLNLKVNKSNTVVDSIVACDSLKWIDGKTYFEDNDTSVFILQNLEGCDSIVKLNLVVKKLDLTTNASVNSIAANMVGQNYQWLDCNNLFKIIPGENNQSFIPIINGVYAVEISNDVCKDTSDCVSISSLETMYSDNVGTVLIYPNPGNDLITIEFSQSTIGSVTMINQRNQIVYYHQDAGSYHQFNPNIASGVYYIIISNTTSIKHFKYIKK